VDTLLPSLRPLSVSQVPEDSIIGFYCPYAALFADGPIQECNFRVSLVILHLRSSTAIFNHSEADSMLENITRIKLLATAQPVINIDK
jgi:hypothetical protein